MTSGRVLLLLAAVLVALVQARAAPLDADSCTKLKGEHSDLESAGVEANMAKGPEWAKANLGPEKLAQIRRFIEVEEMLLFRCRDKSLVNLPAEVDPAPTSDAKEQDKKKDQDKKKGEPEASPPGAAKKTKAPPPAKSPPPAKKKTEPNKAASKTSPQQAKQGSDAAKAKAPAKPPAKQPAEPAPPAAPEKGANN